MTGNEWIAPARPDLRPTRHIVIDPPIKGEWWLLAAGASVALWLCVFKLLGWI
jgi:hypothetical protein